MTFIKNDQNIYKLYNAIIHTKLLSAEYAVVFVYNEESLIDDIEHSTECITSIEKDMIINSFRKSAQYVYAINGEDSFIRMISTLKKKHHYIFVYSMAQNIAGIGRRSLVPLLCDYCKLNNIGSNFYASTLGGDKELMYKLIVSHVNNNIPFTVYINETTNLTQILESIESGTYILKPNDESASIGVEKIDISRENTTDILNKLTIYRKKHLHFCIQEYIDGPEIEVPLLFHEHEYYCPGCVEILNSSPSGYLDYDTVKMDDYSFEEYTGELSTDIITCSKDVAKALGFETICRIDFRIKNNVPYIIDIGANPTISFHSSTNYIFRKRFGDSSAVYQLLLFIGLANDKSFKPPFDKTE
ncbi:MAG: ATP-grasp domain-containing protein [Bacilli bacterium]|nr:ATP-grasp domain-containing protein [Bacilli bacterium]